MSILDEWEHGSTAVSATYGSSFSDPTAVFADDMLAPAPRVPTDDIFALELVERSIARGRGVLRCGRAASECLVFATDEAAVLRVDLSHSTSPVADYSFARVGADIRVQNVFCDPQGGMHILVVVQQGGSHETHHISSSGAKKTRLLQRLRGVNVTAVAWDAAAVTESSTGSVLIGSGNGKAYELVVEDRKEKQCRQLFDLEGQAIITLSQQVLGEGQILVLIATAVRLYVLRGGPTLGALGTHYQNEPIGLLPCLQSTSHVPMSVLSLYYPPGLTTAARLAWATEGGLLLAEIAADAVVMEPAQDDDQPPPIPVRGLGNLHRLPWVQVPGLAGLLQGPTTGPGSSDDLQDVSIHLPLDMVLTEYHMLFLLPFRLVVVNSVSLQAVQTIPLGPGAGALHLGPSAVGMSTVVGLLSDDVASISYLYTEEDLYEVTIREEGREMWRVYLDVADYTHAMLAATNQQQRDAVYLAQAEAAFARGEEIESGKFYGRMMSSELSFEEISIKFIDDGKTAGLQAFLETRLEALRSGERAQVTLLVTWLLELYLDQLNRLLLRAQGQQGAEYAALADKLRAFLTRWLGALDVGTTTSMLASYGRVEELMHFAALRQDHEALLECYIQQGNASKALGVLRKPNVSPELWYKFVPSLLAMSPQETTDAIVIAQPPLDPRRLLPALMRYGEDGAAPVLKEQAIRYVSFATQRLCCSDAAVHNLAVALYSQDPDEVHLQQYLRTARGPLGAPLYDPKYALRLVRERGRKQSTVALLCETGLYEDAVLLALTFDMGLAISVANRPEDDEQLQRKLWLAIARHVITEQYIKADPSEQGESVKRISAFLEESGGVIKIEDLLPLFPEFVSIDNFKDAICNSLEAYNSQINSLKEDMEEATRIADALRKDLAALEQRTATLDLSEPCAACDIPLMDPSPPNVGPAGGSLTPFFLFPSGNAYHGSCLAAAVSSIVSQSQQKRIQSLCKKLIQIPEAHELTAEARQLREQLQTEIGAQDPLSSDLLVLAIDKPFIGQDEASEVASWRI